MDLYRRSCINNMDLYCRYCVIISAHAILYHSIILTQLDLKSLRAFNMFKRSCFHIPKKINVSLQALPFPMMRRNAIYQNEMGTWWYLDMPELLDGLDIR